MDPKIVKVVADIVNHMLTRKAAGGDEIDPRDLETARDLNKAAKIAEAIRGRLTTDTSKEAGPTRAGPRSKENKG